MPYLQNATDFLVQAIIGFALYIALLRFWMQWVRADFRNQFGQFIISATNPAVIPLRKLLPSINTVDTATVVLAYLIAVIKIIAFLGLRNQLDYASPLDYAIWGFGVLIKYSIYLFFAAIIIQAIASWVNPHSYHPILSVASAISDPILAPARRLIPSMGGIDFSPVLVLLFLQFSLRLIVAPILPLPV